MNKQTLYIVGFLAAVVLFGFAGQASAALSVFCSASPNPADVNQAVTFSSNVSGGSGAGTYNYTWSFACTGSGSTCQSEFSSAGSYTAYLSVTSQAESQTTSCTAIVNQNCITHDHKACYGTSVFWYDSCGNKEDPFQACTVNQICQTSTATCVDVACTTNAQCGTNGFVGDPFCQSGDIYKAYKTYTCSNPGTASSSCSSSLANQLFADCTQNQTCSNGQCQNVNITCSTNAQCGTNGFIGSPFCQNGDVFQNYRTYTCNNPGTANSSCSNSDAAQLKNTCSSSQTCSNGTCSNQDNLSVQTNSATNIYNNQATLNGYVSTSGSNNTYVWFQWGTTTSYGNETTRQQQNFSGSFSQNINLYSGNYYHFRAVVQDNYGNTVYGQDMTFTAGSTQNFLIISKTARNMTTGNSNWSNSVYASSSDVLMFMITIQTTGNQDAQNVFVRDYLPNNLIYRNQLVISGSNNNYNNYSGDITSGISFGTISAGQTITITYQAQVGPAQNFNYGTNTLNNSVSVTSSNSGYNPASNATIFVNRTGVLGTSSISTGLTNNFWLDSFFLPLLIALALVWIFRSGILRIGQRLDYFKSKEKDYKANKELKNRISKIQKTEVKL